MILISIIQALFKLEKHHSNIVQAHISQILKILISTFKGNIFEIHTFCLISEDPRSQIMSYGIFSDTRRNGQPPKSQLTTDTSLSILVILCSG
jgi:hypothetical protein